MPTNRYLQHLQNTSPAKTAYSFSRGERFSKIYYQTPNKYYDCIVTQSKRSTSLGFGKKIDFVNKATMDPGKYQYKGQFQLSKERLKNHNQSTFGQSHQNIFLRKLNSIKTPGPGQYYPQNYKNREKFYMGMKVKYPENELAKLKLGPQSYSIQNCIQRISKFKASKTFRIKTQMSHTAKLKLMEHLSTRAVPGPGAYNPQKLVSLQSLMESKGTSFSRQKRLKTQSSLPLGPGSYPVFSVFGSYQNDQ